jgi:hypothetical protein
MPTLALFLGCLMGAAPAAGQWAELRVEENVRAEPNGTIIAQLIPGSRVRVVATEGDWTRVTLEGSVWIGSLQARGFGAYDLVVSEPGGENLRAEPQGRIVGRLGEGTLLEEVSREPGWAHVRRTAWLWTPSLAFQEEAPGDLSGREEAARPREDVPAPPTPAPGSPPAAAPPPAAPTPTPGEAPVEEWIRVSPPGQGILAAPEGDTLALALGDADLRVLARDGNWARVRVEGWLWLPGNAAGDGQRPADDVVLRDVGPAQISDDPDRYRGRVVELELQFISVERAERIRTDFQEGEPFLLTRGTESGRGFVYVALPADRVPEAERLTPLARLRVVGRVRTGAAALTGSPILDLMDLRILR